MEVRQVEAKIEEKKNEEQQVRDDLSSWVKLFSEPVEMENYLKVDHIETSMGNTAGVNIPILEKVVYQKEIPDLYATPPWLDDGIKTLEHLIHLRAEREILKEQHRLLGEELRTTSQRVNLFEKVKIPECSENIRTIRIFLSDMDTAAVARAKIAKGKSVKEVVA